MRNSYTRFYALVLLTFGTLTFLPHTFAQGAAPENMVRLVYFLPNDRSVRPERVEAFRQLIKDAQEFYADQMESHGYGRKTFNIETEANGTPIVHRIDGKFNENHYYTGVSDFKIWEEIYEHFDDLQHIYLIAIDLSQETLNDGGSCGLGGIGFLPIGGEAWGAFGGKFSIRHRHETSGEEALGGSAIIPASGHCFYDTKYTQNHKIRVTTHELGHAFGLDHDFRGGKWNNDTVMGGRAFHLSSCAAEWLSVHRFFNTKPIDKNQRGSVSLLGLRASERSEIHLRFQVNDPNGLHQAQLLVPEDGSWGPLMLVDCQELDGQTQTVEFVTTELAAISPDRVVLQFMDDLGYITWATIRVDIASLLPRPKVVSIPDRNLAAAVRKTLGLTSNAQITDQAMQKLTRLEAKERRIKSLTGLEYATQLEFLELRRNQITDIRPLTNLKSLKELILEVNNIRDIRPLANLTQLTLLYIAANPISDFTPLLNLTKLEHLALWSNGIRDITLVADKIQLRRLYLWDNKIRDVSPLANLTQLQELHLERNQIRDVSPLTGLVNLEILKLSGNPIQDTSPLANLTKLREVDIEIRKPTPVVKITAAQRPPMYWVDAEAGTLHRLVGNKVENLLPNVQNATNLAVDAASNKIYWAEQTGKNRGRIRGANLDGSSLQTLATSLSVPTGIALDAAKDKLYWTNTSGRVKRVNVNGKQNQALIKNLKAPSNITLDIAGGKLYWTEASERIRRANLNGKSLQNIASDLDPISGIAIAGQKIYWTEVTSGGGGKIRRANLNGSNANTLAKLWHAPLSIAIDPVGNKLYWTESNGRIRRANLNGKQIQNVVSGLSTPINIVLGSARDAPAAAPTQVAEIPDQTVLLANYPNPFNPETWIPYQLAKASDVKITIYDMHGAVVRQLELGHQSQGFYTSRSRAAYWDGCNNQGERVASGIYFYQLETDTISSTRKMLILK